MNDTVSVQTMVEDEFVVAHKGKLFGDDGKGRGCCWLQVRVHFLSSNGFRS